MEKRGKKFYLAIAVICIIFFIFINTFFIFAQENNSTVKTNLSIPNNPPILLKPIPNWSWSSGTNLTNAFNLNDYFADESGEPMNFSYSLVDNVTIVIDEYGNVSFYPDQFFLGERNLTFYATDNTLLTSPSNLVFLFIGSDIEPPQWFNPAKSKSTIYQNDYINFSATWTDNLQLSYYTFFIKQSETWTESFGEYFSGKRNISTSKVQISASGGNFVYWYFCGYDTTSNRNCTDIQTINISSKDTGYIPPSAQPGGETSGEGIGGGQGAVITGYSMETTQKKAVKNYMIDPESFRVSLKQGSTETRILKIINIGTEDIMFNLSFDGLSDLIKLSEYSFNVTKGEIKKITVDFTAKRDTPVEQYFGKIVVNSNIDYREIPIVIEVNLFEEIFTVNVNISEKYKRVRPGKMVLANITIKSIKDISAGDIRVYYAIKDFYGTIYDSSEEVLLLNGILYLERNLSVLLSARDDEYIFYARASNDKNSAMNSDNFFVFSGFEFAYLLKSSFIFILIAILSIIALLMMINYRRERQKERILNLYLMLNELKELIKDGNYEKAIELYIRVKSAYGEPVSKIALQNKEKLKEEIKKLSIKLKEDVNKSKEEVNKSKEKDDLKESNKKKEIEENDKEKNVNSIEKENKIQNEMKSEDINNKKDTRESENLKENSSKQDKKQKKVKS